MQRQGEFQGGKKKKLHTAVKDLPFFRRYQWKTLLLPLKLFDFVFSEAYLQHCKQALGVMIKHILTMFTLLRVDEAFNPADHDKIAFQPHVTQVGNESRNNRKH